MKKKAKVILDLAVFFWFIQKRSKGVQISAALLCKKMREVSKTLQGEGTKMRILQKTWHKMPLFKVRSSLMIKKLLMN